MLYLGLQQRHPLPRSIIATISPFSDSPRRFSPRSVRTDPSSYPVHSLIRIDQCCTLAFSSATLCHDDTSAIRQDDSSATRHDQLVPTRHPNPVHLPIRHDQCCTLTFSSATLCHDQTCRFATTNPSAIRHDDSSAIRHTTTSSYRPVILCCSLPDSH
jgi:hypothetical protein